MNITEALDLATKISVLSARSSWFWTKKSVCIIFEYLTDVLGQFLHIGFTLSNVTLIIVLIGLVKSLRPRYNFYKHSKIHSSASSHKTVVKRKSDDRKLVYNSQPRGWSQLLRRQLVRLFESIPVKLEHDYKEVNDDCKFALDSNGIQATFNQMPWSKSSVDVETVNWLNELISSLWPSLKTILYECFIFDLLRPKHIARCPLVGSKRLASQQTKLSVLLSTRRKLEQLRRKAASDNRDSCYLDRNLFSSIGHALKLFSIYFKQFVVDNATLFLKNSTDRKSINNEGATKGKGSFKAVIESLTNWRSSLNITKKPKLRRKLRRKSRSAPVHNNSKKLLINVDGISNPFNKMRLKDKRIRLAGILNKAMSQSVESNKRVTLERTRLGERAPKISGVRVFEDRLSLTQGSDLDSSSMNFMTELIFDSDDKFYIRLGLPFIGSVEMDRLNINVRVMLTFNHTLDNQDKNFDILRAPHESNIPLINYVQVTLVDIPQLDWNFRKRDIKHKKPSRQATKVSTTLSSWIGKKFAEMFDPIDIVDHSYFKFLVHLMMNICLKWFRPFEIEIGDFLYLKTL